MQQAYMVTVVTRYAVKASSEMNAVHKIKNDKGREFDVQYGTEVYVIDPDSVYTHGLEDLK